MSVCRPSQHSFGNILQKPTQRSHDSIRQFEVARLDQQHTRTYNAEHFVQRFHCLREVMIRLLAQNEVKRRIGKAQRFCIFPAVVGDSSLRFGISKKRNGEISRQCLRSMRYQILRIQAETTIANGQPVRTGIRAENRVRELIHALKAPAIDRTEPQPRCGLLSFGSLF